MLTPFISCKKSRNLYFKCMKTIVSEKGQITIPKKLREQLGLHPGSVLDFTEEKGRLVARKKVVEDPAAKWRGTAKLPVGENVTDYLKTIRER